jgi:tRNA nucleotidyltransferase (CCA-adding enzyme)
VNIPLAVESVVALIVAAGGRALLVGGAVVDHLQGREPKDWDIEVYGLSMTQLEETLTQAGLNPKAVGREFGILKVNGGLEVDVSVPRRENKVGKGHRDFAMELDPNMTPKEAARRRDLTINSIAYDLNTREVVDPWGGVDDLKSGIIRATDPETFAEDPLRVLRIMQLLPRKGHVLETGTLELCAQLVDQFQYLSSERVLVEWEKLLLRAEKPSTGLNFLRACGWIRHFPELEALVGCEQHPEWHPEGDAWQHTLAVLDNAAKVRDQIPEEWRLGFMFGALLHDVGKPSTTLEDFTSRGHDTAGVPLASTFMERLTNNKVLLEQVSAIVGQHMQPYNLSQGEARPPAWRRLHNKMRLDVLGWMSICDSCAEPGLDVLTRDDHLPSKLAWHWFEELGATAEKIDPILKGRDLIASGHKPGPAFGKALQAAYEAQLDGVTDRAELLAAAIEVLIA